MFARSSLAALVLAAVCGSVNAQFPGDCDRNYVVAPGDTCDSISIKENVSTFQLANANQGVINAECSNLSVGETICLGQFDEDCQVNHVVQPGDTCQSIAQAAGTTVGLILVNNPNVNSGCTNIYPGEVLCTANEAIGIN